MENSTQISLSGFEACIWVWNTLWKAEQPSFSKLNMCDVIQIREKDGIISWLFTSSDGLIKSKTKEKWNSTFVISRINDSSDQDTFPAMLLLKYNTKCFRITKERIREILDSKDCECSGAIILTSHILGGFNIFEHVYETQTNSFTAKHTTFNLIGSKAKGKYIEKTQIKHLHSDESSEHSMEGDIPAHRVVSLNKFLNLQAKEFTQNLITSLESRSKCKILKIQMICVLESESIMNAEAGKKVWLHHITHITFMKNKRKSENSSFSGSESYEIRSRLGNESEVSSNYGSDYSGLREKRDKKLEKCSGDFCYFSDYKVAFTKQEFQELIFEEELEKRAMGDGDVEGDEWDLKRETKKAILRHKPEASLTKASPKPSPKREGLGAGSESSMFSYPMNVNVDSNTSHNNNEGKEQSHPPQPLLGYLDPKNPPFKVNLKTVMLAREEMGKIQKQIESLEKQSLPSPLPSSSYSHPSPINDRQFPEIIYNRDEHRPWPPLLFHWWVTEGRHLAKRNSGRNVCSLSVPSFGAHGIGQAVISQLSEMVHDEGQSSSNLPHPHLAPISQSQLSSSSTRILSSHKPPLPSLSSSSSSIGDEHSQPHSTSPSDSPLPVSKAAGHLSWYYSSIKVCERCHYVYSNLDRCREDLQTEILREKKRILDEEESMRSKELERKIFNQRKFVSRISKVTTSSPLPSASASFSSSESFSTLSPSPSLSHARNPYNFSYQPSHLPMGIASSTSSASLTSSSSSSSITSHVPKRALPPLPWKLTDESHRKEYESNTAVRGSAFVRGIGEKALRAKETASFSSSLSHSQSSLYQIGEGVFRDGNEEEDEEGGEGRGDPQEHDYRWREFVGANRSEQRLLLQQQQQQQQQQQHRDKQQRREERRKGRSVVASQFDASRLLHPWQRDLQNLRKQITEQEGGGEEEGGGGPSPSEDKSFLRSQASVPTNPEPVSPVSAHISSYLSFPFFIH